MEEVLWNPHNANYIISCHYTTMTRRIKQQVKALGQSCSLDRAEDETISRVHDPFVYAEP